MNNLPLSTLPQYHFDRDAFCQVFNDVLNEDEGDRVYVACQGNTHRYDSFSLFHSDDEYYILHRDSGVLINWYKHIGRTNTCNREDFTLDNLRSFFELLKKDMRGDLYA